MLLREKEREEREEREGESGLSYYARLRLHLYKQGGHQAAGGLTWPGGLTIWWIGVILLHEFIT